MTGGGSKGGKDPGKSEKERPAIVAGGDSQAGKSKV